jgi:amidophosphoribosyltransferase
MEDEIHHECGVCGFYGVENAADFAYYALHSLQHRGQQGCGITTFDNGKMLTHKGIGLVGEVFNKQNIATLQVQLPLVTFATPPPMCAVSKTCSP